MLLKVESHPIRLPAKLAPGILALFESFSYSQDTGGDVWEFAVSIEDLRKLGLADHDLRWLVLKGLVQHAAEVTVTGDDGRSFRPTGNLTFHDRTCAVLTEEGASLVTSGIITEAVVEPPVPQERPTSTPCWHPHVRKLQFKGRLVKWFKWRAVNQEQVLAAFQEEGWPTRIDDPLPPHPDQDSRRRLSDTIKCLNRKQTHEMIRFHGDGTGEGVVWECIDPVMH